MSNKLTATFRERVKYVRRREDEEEKSKLLRKRLAFFCLCLKALSMYVREERVFSLYLSS